MTDIDQLIRDHINDCTPSAPPQMSPRLTRSLANGDKIPPKRAALAVGATAAAAALVVAGVAIARDQIAETTPSGAVPASGDVPVLVTLPDTGLHMEAIVSGTLGVRDGCFTVDGAVLIAPEGSTVSPDGQSIVMPGIATVQVGDKVIGGGGWVNEAPDAAQPSNAPCVEPVREDNFAILSAPLESPTPTPTTSESQIKNVQVPDVIGDKEAQAVQQLQQVGLEVTVVYEAAPAGTTLDAGTVLSASPAPGTNVRVGTTVVLKVVDPDKG